MFRAFYVVSAVLLAGLLAAKPSPLTPDPLGPRPIDGPDTVFLEDMTWMEIRDAMLDGKKTVIIATGGIEQNGPYLVLDKHNVIVYYNRLSSLCALSVAKHLGTLADHYSVSLPGSL